MLLLTQDAYIRTKHYHDQNWEEGKLQFLCENYTLYMIISQLSHNAKEVHQLSQSVSTYLQFKNLILICKLIQFILPVTHINETSPLLNHKWVPVTKAWHVLRWWMEKWPPTRKAAANILNKQSQTADKG